MTPVNRTFSPFGAEYGLSSRWGLLSQLYIRSFGVVDLPSRLRARGVLRELKKLAPKRIVDFGCGTGCYAFYLTRRSDTGVWAVDKDESRIFEGSLVAKSIARGNLSFIRESQGDGLRSLGTGSFDAVVAIEVLQYVRDLPVVLGEMNRILEPGGFLVGHVPILGYLREAEHTLFSDESLTQLLENAGFETIAVRRTLGGFARCLCNVFDLISNNRLVVSLLFPLLLLASHGCSTHTPDGNYRLFVCRKADSPHIGGA